MHVKASEPRNVQIIIRFVKTKTGKAVTIRPPGALHRLPQVTVRPHPQAVPSHSGQVTRPHFFPAAPRGINLHPPPGAKVIPAAKMVAKPMPIQLRTPYSGLPKSPSTSGIPLSTVPQPPAAVRFGPPPAFNLPQ